MLHRTFKHLILALMLTSLLLAVPAALAAQEAPAETTSTPSGLMVLAFVLGVGGILAVGVRWLVLDSFKPDDQ